MAGGGVALIGTILVPLLVLGRDGSRVYTVEGNSGDACKIKSYDLNYQCIKGYGLMNW